MSLLHLPFRSGSTFSFLPSFSPTPPHTFPHPTRCHTGSGRYTHQCGPLIISLGFQRASLCQRVRGPMCSTGAGLGAVLKSRLVLTCATEQVERQGASVPTQQYICIINNQDLASSDSFIFTDYLPCFAICWTCLERVALTFEPLARRPSRSLLPGFRNESHGL